MRPYLQMLVSAMSFAVMGAFAHGARGMCDWQVIALSRSLLAVMLAALLAFASGASLVYFRPRTLWMRSIAGSISVMCNFYALTALPIADALTLSNMYPIWIAVLSWPLLGEVPEREVWFGVVCGMAGVVLMQQPYLAEGNMGTVAATLGSVTSAIALIGLHRLKGIDPNAIVVHFSVISILFLLGSLFVWPTAHELGPQLSLSGTLPFFLLAVGVFATIGQLLLTRALASGVPARVAIVGLSQVAFAVVLDIVVWGRQFEPQTLLGMFLVLVPTAWFILRPKGVKSSGPSQPLTEEA
jgi:drug/metabolite transporter (DMT)-like permease